MRRRVLILCLLLLAALDRDAFAGLPETLGGKAGQWVSSQEEVLPLTAQEGVGRWTRRLYYRDSPRAVVEVNLMEGTGPRWHGAGRALEAPSAGGPGNMGEASEYRVMSVAGRYAVLERYPHLPLALAVALGPEETLTLEGNVEENVLLAMAEELMR